MILGVRSLGGSPRLACSNTSEWPVCEPQTYCCAGLQGDSLGLGAVEHAGVDEEGADDRRLHLVMTFDLWSATKQIQINPSGRS